MLAEARWRMHKAADPAYDPRRALCDGVCGGGAPRRQPLHQYVFGMSERAKLADTPNVGAGTLNSHLPKRTVTATQMLEWLEEPDEAD